MNIWATSAIRLCQRSSLAMIFPSRGYEAVLELNAELAACPMTTASSQRIAKLTEAVRQAAYSAGYANAEFDAAENS